MHNFEAYERLIECSVLIALAVLFIVAALSLLAGCGEEALEEDFPDSDRYYHYKLVAREPLPYQVAVRVGAAYKGFSGDGGNFVIDDAPYYVTVYPDTSVYYGIFPKVLDDFYCSLYNAWPYDWDKNNHDPEWRGIVTSIDVEISSFISGNDFYTIGESKLTLGSR